MQIDFRAVNGAQSLRPVVWATAFGVTIEYHLESQYHNACNHLVDSFCPLSDNEDATYSFEFAVTKQYPAIPVAVELSLLDQFNATVFCSIIDVQIRLS